MVVSFSELDYFRYPKQFPGWGKNESVGDPKTRPETRLPKWREGGQAAGAVIRKANKAFGLEQ